MMYLTIKFPAKVGSMSLIGVGKQRPCFWGNYFDLARYNKMSPRVLNMWAENLVDAKSKFLKDEFVKIRLYTIPNETYGDRHVCIIDDERIPQDYYYNKLCFTGSPFPTTEIAEDIYNYLGDPSNELEQFTNPVSYYAKRGGVYNKEKGFITYTPESRAKANLK